MCVQIVHLHVMVRHQTVSNLMLDRVLIIVEESK